MKSRNFLASFVSVAAAGTANTEFSVAHGLIDQQGNGIVPAQAFVCRIGMNAIVYLGTTAWDTQNAYLKCDTASAPMSLLFFV